jgi:hypothetical protein
MTPGWVWRPTRQPLLVHSVLLDPPHGGQRLRRTQMIELKGLTKKYGSVTAVENVSTTIAPGIVTD